jgi:transcriptional regulator with XRE-family HTH domain
MIMVIGEQLKEIRETKQLSQGDIEKKTGLLRCYVSRVENGHTIPSVETLEKFARALEVPLYRLFVEGNQPVKKPDIGATRGHDEDSSLWGGRGKERRELRLFAKALSRMNDRDRNLLFASARQMAKGAK